MLEDFSVEDLVELDIIVTGHLSHLDDTINLLVDNDLSNLISLVESQHNDVIELRVKINNLIDQMDGEVDASLLFAGLNLHFPIIGKTKKIPGILQSPPY